VNPAGTCSTLPTYTQSRRTALAASVWTLPVTVQQLVSARATAERRRLQLLKGKTAA